MFLLIIIPGELLMRHYYDPQTALTFLLAGIGVGTLLTLILSPRDRSPQTISGMRSEGRRLEERPVRAV